MLLLVTTILLFVLRPAVLSFHPSEYYSDYISSARTVRLSATRFVSVVGCLLTFVVLFGLKVVMVTVMAEIILCIRITVRNTVTA